MSTRRAPVQGETHRPDGTRCRKVSGSVAWEEHQEAYARRYGRDQSAERIAERGGFGWWELTKLLGREPATWEPR